MSSPRQFVENFYQGKAAAHAATRTLLQELYTKSFSGRLLEHSGHFLPSFRTPEICEETEDLNGCTLVFTKDDLRRGVVKRERFHLSPAGDTWKILRIDWDCTWCHNTGVFSGAPCDKCGGSGWRDPIHKFLNPTLD